MDDKENTCLKYRITSELRTCRCRDQGQTDKSLNKNTLSVKIVGASKEQMEWMTKEIETVILTVGATCDEVIKWR